LRRPVLLSRSKALCIAAVLVLVFGFLLYSGKSNPYRTWRRFTVFAHLRTAGDIDFIENNIDTLPHISVIIFMEGDKELSARQCDQVREILSHLGPYDERASENEVEYIDHQSKSFTMILFQPPVSPPSYSLEVGRCSPRDRQALREVLGQDPFYTK
jgi:hypothetical protein